AAVGAGILERRLLVHGRPNVQPVFRAGVPEQVGEHLRPVPRSARGRRAARPVRRDRSCHRRDPGDRLPGRGQAPEGRHGPRDARRDRRDRRDRRRFAWPGRRAAAAPAHPHSVRVGGNGERPVIARQRGRPVRLDAPGSGGRRALKSLARLSVVALAAGMVLSGCSFGGGGGSGTYHAVFSRAVPVEPDEVLRSLQDYLGALDPNTVTKFVENAATILNGNGEELNSLIAHGADVMATLSAKREDLASLITELNDLTQTLATRQR